MNPGQRYARDFAARITALGFVVYLAERGDYGFITDATESRVLHFGSQGDLSGAYTPPSVHSGTGWRMESTMGELQTAEDVRRVLYADAPRFAYGPRSEKGWQRYSTVADILALYGSSSRYARFNPEF